MRRLSVGVLGILALLGGPAVHAALEDVLITEFQASNRTTLLDEDGESSDWIELHNSGTTAVDLGGCYLTDSANNLTKWRFPSVTIAPGGFLIVFASEKDRRTPGEELHTNFRLDTAGELLVLVTPDGASVIAGFAPSYPRQIEDTSYGLSGDAEVTTVIDDASPLRVLVPSDDSLGASWTSRTFDDGSWRAGTPGVGFERSSGFEPFIATDVETEMYGVNSSIYIRIPFDLDDPGAVDSLRLRVRYDDGFAAYVNGVEAVLVNTPSPLTWDARASRSNADSAAVTFETFDLSAARGALVPGENVLAIQALNFGPTSSDFLLDPRLDVVTLGDNAFAQEGWFPVPTPGSPNESTYPDLSGDPVFSHASGAYPAAFSLSIDVPAGATVRYTTDGSRPNEGSSVYSSPLTINTTTIVHARLWEDGKAPGQSVSAAYTILASSVRSFSSNLPIVIVDSLGRSIGQDAFVPAILQTIDTTDGRARMTDPADWAGRCGIKIRGSSSSGFPKKQFAVETWDEFGQDDDSSLLGFPEDSDWILYAPYSDKTLMRNVLSYDWSNQAGLWAVGTKFVEVYLKSSGTVVSSAHYAGVYVLMEKIKRGPDRVDIEELSPTDDAEPEISGGYIFKKDRLDPGDSGFTTSRGQTLAWVEPKEQEVTAAQRSWFVGYMNEFESVLYGANFGHPVNGYVAYIDPKSWIEHHLLVELTKNIDGYRLSTFFNKPRSDVLYSGPIWDYNLSLGNANYLQGWIPQGWYYTQVGSDAYPWWPRLFQHLEFEQAYIDRWQDLRDETWATQKLLAQIDETAAHLEESQQRNFERWPILGTYVWPNEFIGNTYAEEIGFMKSWLEQRLAWMDSNWLGKPSLNQNGGGFDEPFELRMVAQAGTIYYTTDGTDPRLPGGGVSPTAESYGSSSSEVLVSEAVTSEVRVLVPTGDPGSWTSRTFNDSGWLRGTAGIGVGYERGSGYEAYIDVDVESGMYNTIGSCLLRYRFQVDDPGAISFLTLRMRYDDGFVAYINGQQVAASNAPASPSWNSEAAGQHDDGLSVTFETFNIQGVDSLVAGTNVLAIHGLNFGLTSSDFLIEPELSAVSSEAGDAVLLTGPTTIKARASTGGANWSGIREATFIPWSDLPLRITELHYHPAPLPEDSPFSAADLEFIELRNVSDSTINLLGVRFVDGVEFDFSTGSVGSLPAGEHVLIVRHLAAFDWFYGLAGLRVAGQYTGNLANGGEKIRVLDRDDLLVHDFAYSDLWHPTTDGGGPSLRVVDPAAHQSEWAEATQWAPSAEDGGSPGLGDGDPPPQRGWQVPGDANSDGRVDLSDSIRLLRVLFAGADLPLPCGDDAASEGNLAVLDLNGDQAVDVSDAVFGLDWLFTSGPAPAAGTECARIVGCPDVCSN